MYSCKVVVLAGSYVISSQDNNIIGKTETSDRSISDTDTEVQLFQRTSLTNTTKAFCQDRDPG